jgi:hypothetical protein
VLVFFYISFILAMLLDFPVLCYAIHFQMKVFFLKKGKAMSKILKTTITRVDLSHGRSNKTESEIEVETEHHKDRQGRK